MENETENPKEGFDSGVCILLTDFIIGPLLEQPSTPLPRQSKLLFDDEKLK